jgi:molybdenum cofactor guanylyltransferase
VPAITGVILAGGQSKRLGSDKALFPLLGRPVLAHVISRIRPLVDDMLLVTGPIRRYEEFGIPIVTDAVPVRGSLAGVYSGLCASRNRYSLVVACDMPFLNADLLGYMIGLAPEWDVVMPRSGEGLEPLHAVYSRSCLAPIRAQLDAGDLRIVDFLERVRVRYVDDSEVERFDPERRSFFNLNTRSDGERMRLVAASLGMREDQLEGSENG